MTFNTIRDPGIARGFSILSQALAPNSQGLINADLSRVKRDGMLIENDMNQQKLLAARNEDANRGIVQSILAGNPDLTDPAVRADLMSAIAGAPGGFQHGPGFATGSSTFINPNFVNESDFSRVLLGTGVVGAHSGTPAGHRAALDAQAAQAAAKLEADNAHNASSLANALTRTQMEQDGAMARTIYQGQNPNASNRAPLDVSPQDANGLMKRTAEVLLSMYPDAEPDPEVLSTIMPRVSQLYQVSRNAEMAIQQALAEIPLEEYTYDTWKPFDQEQRMRLPKNAPPVAPSGAADKPGAANGSPAAPGQLAQEGKIYVNPKTGQQVILRGGKWETVAGPMP